MMDKFKHIGKFLLFALAVCAMLGVCYLTMYVIGQVIAWT